MIPVRIAHEHLVSRRASSCARPEANRLIRPVRIVNSATRKMYVNCLGTRFGMMAPRAAAGLASSAGSCTRIV